MNFRFGIRCDVPVADSWFMVVFYGGGNQKTPVVGYAFADGKKHLFGRLPLMEAIVE
ncbi:MAG: hypothetical protein KBT20_00105 [Bacteroidales bacterium]|nr:hypothetical protein [Candidatus Liminaster caballi]